MDMSDSSKKFNYDKKKHIARSVFNKYIFLTTPS